jgi:hypothetical protein
MNGRAAAAALTEAFVLIAAAATLPALLFCVRPALALTTGLPCYS